MSRPNSHDDARAAIRPMRIAVRLLAGVEADLVDVLRLEGGEEALHGRIIEAVAAAAHGLGDAVPLQHYAVGLGGVLGGFKWSSQHGLCCLIEATGQALLRVFSKQASFGAGR